MKNLKIVILYSGGLDSKLMYALAKKRFPKADIKKVYFDIGADYCWKEIQTLEDDVLVHKMPWFCQSTHSKEGSASGNIFIPGRNMVLATIAASMYLPDEIWIGALLGEMHADSTDKNDTFREKTNDLLGYVLSPWNQTQVVFPLAEMGFGKFEATRWGVENGLKNIILGSSSCLNGESGACGRCVVCARRAGIFAQLGLNEKYNVDPWTSPEHTDMFISMIRSEIYGGGHYDEYRRREIVPTLRAIYQGMSDPEILVVLEELKNKNSSELKKGS